MVASTAQRTVVASPSGSVTFAADRTTVEVSTAPAGTETSAVGASLVTVTFTPAVSLVPPSSTTVTVARYVPGSG